MTWAILPTKLAHLTFVEHIPMTLECLFYLFTSVDSVTVKGWKSYSVLSDHNNTKKI